MLDIYLLTLALALALAVVLTVVLQAVSRSPRFEALFHIRGVTERPRWGGVVFLATFALTPFIASALSHHASEFFTPNCQLPRLSGGDRARLRRRLRR